MKILLNSQIIETDVVCRFYYVLSCLSIRFLQNATFDAYGTKNDQLFMSQLFLNHWKLPFKKQFFSKIMSDIE